MNNAQKQNEFVKEPVVNTIENIDNNKKLIQQNSTDQKIIDLLPIVWPYIEKELAEQKTDKELAEGFNVELKQMRSWLSMAVKKGDVKKLSKPTRYVRLKNKGSLDIWIEN
jgi:hypothetical protein